MSFNFNEIIRDYPGIVIIYVLVYLIIIFYLVKEHNKILKYKNIQYLLEFPQKYYYGKENLVINEGELKDELDDFIKYTNNANYIVSLSGGVDSMVTLALLMNVIPKDKIVTASINYNQRKESKEEIRFLKNYLYYHQIENYSHDINIGIRKTKTIKRKTFEETSQKIRINLYKEIIQKKQWCEDNTIILLGHHLDDLYENIFNNFMTGRKLTDLGVMKKITFKQDLIFGRPFLNYPKSKIYQIAHQYNIPYFKDTTPLWSRRGLMRNKLFPLLEEIYPNFKKDLTKQTNNSCLLNKLIKKYFVNKFKKKINRTETEENIIYKWDNKLNNNNEIIWQERLSYLLHTEGYPMISLKSIKHILDSKPNSRSTNKFYSLSKKVLYKRNKDHTIIKILKK